MRRDRVWGVFGTLLARSAALLHYSRIAEISRIMSAVLILPDSAKLRMQSNRYPASVRGFV